MQNSGSEQMITFLDPLLRESSTDLRLQNVRNGRTIADHVLTALDSGARRKGLLGLDSMPESSAMILAPTNAIHTFFMRFPIDVAFVAKNGQVLKVRHALAPWRLSGALRAHAVIELPAGALNRSDTGAGDRLEFVSSI